MIYNIKNDTTYGTVIGAIREKNWKYMRYAESLTTYSEVLYNLEEDFMETTDLSEEEVDVNGYMRGLFAELSLSMVSGVDPAPIHKNKKKNANGYIRSGCCDV